MIVGKISGMSGGLGLLTKAEIEKDLNTRGYQLATSSSPSPTSPPATSPAASKPVWTFAYYIKMCVDTGLNYYKLPLKATTAQYIDQKTWDGIIYIAQNSASQIDNQVTVTMNGLRGLGYIGQTPALDQTALATALQSIGTPSDPNALNYSWTTKWGPTILRLIGSTMQIYAENWQDKINFSQLSAQYAQSTGQPLGVPTKSDQQSMINALVQLGYSQAEASSIINKAVPYTAPQPSSIPTWLLPALAVGGGVALIMTRK